MSNPKDRATLHQDSIIASIEQHMDAVARLVNWSIIIAILFWSAGIGGAPTLEAQGIKISAKYAFFVAAGLFTFVNYYALDIFFRLGQLLKNVEDERFVEAVTKLALHKWFANPFAYFGPNIFSGFMTGKGFGLLIILWWFGFSALTILEQESGLGVAIDKFLMGLFLVIGLLSMLAIGRVERVILLRLSEIDPNLFESLKINMLIRMGWVFAGIIVGGLVSVTTIILDD